MTTATKERNGAAVQPAIHRARPDMPLVPVTDKSLAAEASSAHSRINIPFNLDNWKDYPDEVREQVMWFHQHILDENLSWKDAEQAIGYSQTVIYRVLKGIYPGKIDDVIKAIRSYRKLAAQRASIRRAEFVENSISKRVCSTLDYALANQTMTMIVGDSRVGKSIAADYWCIQNNHGRSVKVTAPAIGGAKGFLRRIAKKLGVNRSQPVADMADAILRAFNPNRILIVDQAHWLLPADPRTSNPAGLNFLIDLFEATHCAIALLSTKRLPERFQKGEFLYEQIIGRIGMPVLIPSKIEPVDILPIVEQFVKKPSVALLNRCEKIANEPGRLGIMVETLKVAARLAHKAGTPVTETHLIKAMEIRRRQAVDPKPSK